MTPAELEPQANPTKAAITEQLLAIASDTTEAAGAGLLGAIGPLIQIAAGLGLTDQIIGALPDDEADLCGLLYDAGDFLAGLARLPREALEAPEGSPATSAA